MANKQPLWYQCDCCDDFLCSEHKVRAYDCDCPTIDVFAEHDIYPYDEGSLEEYREKVKKGLI